MTRRGEGDKERGRRQGEGKETRGWEETTGREEDKGKGRGREKGSLGGAMANGEKLRLDFLQICVNYFEKT